VPYSLLWMWPGIGNNNMLECPKKLYQQYSNNNWCKDNEARISWGTIWIKTILILITIYINICWKSRIVRVISITLTITMILILIAIGTITIKTTILFPNANHKFTPSNKKTPNPAYQESPYNSNKDNNNPKDHHPN